MKCLLCENYSLTQHICKKCQHQFLQPSLYKRTLNNGIDVFSFYHYHDIQSLLLTKHTPLGFHIYKLLAKLSFKKFSQTFQWQKNIASLAIDDTVAHGYSHTALLNNALNSSHITPRFHKLQAQNTHSYSGKSRAFRQANPRNFKFSSFKEKEVIVVDDIITTGTTLYEATNLLSSHKKEVLFCLTLSDVNIL